MLILTLPKYDLDKEALVKHEINSVDNLEDYILEYIASEATDVSYKVWPDNNNPFRRFRDTHTLLNYLNELIASNKDFRACIIIEQYNDGVLVDCTILELNNKK